MISKLKRKKLSLFSLVLIAVAIGISVYLPVSLILDIQDRSDQNILKQEVRLAHYLQISQSLFRAGADKDLNDMLHEILRLSDISYFVIYKNGNPVYVKPENHPLAAGHTYAQRAPKAGQDLIDNFRSERSEFLADDTLLTIGLDKRLPGLITETIFGELAVWKVIVQDILTIIAMAAFIFWLHTRDLANLKNNINRFGRLPEHLGSANSAEGEAIIAGLKGYAASEKSLKEKSDKLSSQVLPALKRELFSGQTPPYTFECTLVRTDINGFSQIFNSPYRDRFAKHIDDFFIGLTEIVSRYDGLIYEFVGDEAIFYFKDYTEADFHEDDQLGPVSSINRSIDAIRDIHLLARDINTRTQMEGHRFTVKSALAHGTLRFGPQVDGFSLSGGVLIETVRILSTVTDKAESHLYFSSRHSGHLRDDVQTEKVGTFSLKGYSEDVALVRWISSTPLSLHISNVTAPSLSHTQSPFDFVSNHRSDFSLETIISAAAAARDSWTLDQHLQLVHALRSVKVYRSHHPLGSTLIDWLATSETLAKQSDEWFRLVSAILMIYPNLVPKTALAPRDIVHLESLLDSNDSRTVANTIDVLTRYEIQPIVRPLNTLFANANNRIAANAVIHEGTTSLNDEVIAKLNQMIFGRGVDDARKASGLYALGEIARIIRARDPVYYSTRTDLHRLISKIDVLTNHTNESVAHQATRAVAKAEFTAENFSAAS